MVDTASKETRRSWQKPAHRHASTFESFVGSATCRAELSDAYLEGFAVDEETGLAEIRAHAGVSVLVRVYPPILDDLHVAFVRALDGPTSSGKLRVVGIRPPLPSVEDPEMMIIGPCAASVFAGTDDGVTCFFKSEDGREYVRIDFGWAEIKAALDPLGVFRKEKLTLGFRKKSIVVSEPDVLKLVASAPGKESDPRKKLAEEMRASMMRMKEPYRVPGRLMGLANLIPVAFFVLVAVIVILLTR